MGRCRCLRNFFRHSRFHCGTDSKSCPTGTTATGIATTPGPTVGATAAGCGATGRAAAGAGTGVSSAAGVEVVGTHSCGVGQGDGAVVGVGVGVPLLWIRQVHDGVDGDEAAQVCVVLAGADVDEAVGVVVAADEALLVGPGGGGAAGLAVGGLPADGDGVAVGVDADVLGAWWSLKIQERPVMLAPLRVATVLPPKL